MTAVFVLRHPETAWNVAQRYQGRLEAPLSDEGIRQQASLLDAFDGIALDAVYTSPLGRARRLAESLAAYARADVRIDPRLTEIDMGPWQGLYRAEIEERFPDLYHQWYVAPESVTFPGGESLRDVRARTLSSFCEVFQHHPDGNVAVVTHSVVIQVLAAESLGLELKHLHRLRVSNGGVSIFCGSEAPGSLLTLNSAEAVHGGLPESARVQGCAEWKPRRVTA